MKHETESKMSIQKFKIEKSDHNLFECLICQKNFDPYALADHYLSAHNNIKLLSVQPIRESKIFKCDSCAKSFTQSNNLTRHIKTIHEGHKDYKCDSCGKSFAQPGVLRRHTITVHEGRKYFECDSCVKAFTEAGSLTRHIKTVHEHRKDFKCETCGKSFTDATKLRKHNKNVHKDYTMIILRFFQL